MRMLKGLFSVFKREAEYTLKDINILSIILLAPIAYALLYGSFYVNKVETDVPVAIVDMDKSNASREFIRKLDASQLVKVNLVTGNIAEAKDNIYSMKSHGIVVLDKDFETNIKSFRTTTVKVLLNTTKFLISNDINKAVNELAVSMRSDIRMKFFKIAGFSNEQAEGLSEPIEAEIRPMFNTTESYGDFLIPGILVLIIQQTLMLGLSESVAKERENNTLHNWYLTSNKSLFATMTGKSAFYFVLYSSYSYLFYSVIFKVFKIQFTGSVIALVLLTLIFLLSVIDMTFFISSFFRRKLIALQFLAFTSYPMFLISGYNWPSSAMPYFMQYLTKLFPSTPYLNAFVRITQMGAGLNDVLPELVHLSILAVFYIIVSRIRLKILFSNETKENVKFIGSGFFKKKIIKDK